MSGTDVKVKKAEQRTGGSEHTARHVQCHILLCHNTSMAASFKMEKRAGEIAKSVKHL